MVTCVSFRLSYTIIIKNCLPILIFDFLNHLVKKKEIDIGLSITDTTGKRRRLNAVRKSGKAQAEEQLIDSFNAVDQNNRNMHEKSAQLGGGMKLKIYFVEFLSSFVMKFHVFGFELFIVRTRGNLMGASLNHRNDQSQSEHAQVESHVESPISFDSMSKRLPRGNSLFE